MWWLRRPPWRPGPLLVDRRGVVFVIMAIGLAALLGMAALGLDVGRLYIAAGWAQTVADSAALAAANHLPDVDAAAEAAGQIFEAHRDHIPGQLDWNPAEDIEFYGPGDTVPGYAVLGPSAWAVRVRCHVTMPLSFARALGIAQGGATAHATAVRAPAGRAAITPIWVPNGDYEYGQLIQLIHAPCYDHDHFVPGNFGWLEPPSQAVSFIELLRGDELTPEQLQAATVQIGDVLYGKPGLRIGQVRSALADRLSRAAQPPYDQDTWDNFHASNPRVMIVPLVDYIGGCGRNARYRVVRFAALWLESIYFRGCHSRIYARFVRYVASQAYPDPSAPDGGVYAVALVE